MYVCSDGGAVRGQAALVGRGRGVHVAVGGARRGRGAARLHPARRARRRRRHTHRALAHRQTRAASVHYTSLAYINYTPIRVDRSPDRYKQELQVHYWPFGELGRLGKELDLC